MPVGTVPAPPYVETSYGSAVQTLGDLVGNILKLVMTAGGLVMFVYLLYGGFLYITSGGEKDNTEKAQQTITNAVIGLVILVVSWILIRILETVLGIDILTLRFYGPTD